VRAAKQAVPGLRARNRIAVLATTATALLSACAGAPPRDNGSLPPGKSGGYYLDDGPGANPPANLDQIPDAQPKPELIKASTARPYTAFGRTYTPMTRLAPYKERGTASWYGKRYHGQPTASGELYDMYAMTAAHPTLPIPSYARVTNVRSGKSVVVRINDRGPFRGERLIDLSYTAAYKLGIIGSGSDLVEVESILPGAATAPTVDADARPSRPVAERRRCAAGASRGGTTPMRGRRVPWRSDADAQPARRTGGECLRRCELAAGEGGGG